MGRVDYDTWTRWYGSIPSTIILADPCDIICLSIIVTDVECSRSSHGSTVAGNTIGDGCIACKSSVYTSLIHCPTSSSNAKVCKVCQSALWMSQMKTSDCAYISGLILATQILSKYIDVCLLRNTLYLCALKLNS